ncbi:MAG: diacylglycerol kinase family lipid kinase [Bacillota bacterium]|nr:diacylglycerol kinase family lipid kinase [Bacillota bacterium]
MQLISAAAVVNPVSGNGSTGKTWPAIARAMKQEGLDFEYSFTGAPGEATVLARNFLNQGYELIISVGGDGTVNEVINGFFLVEEAVRKKTSLGIISSGTGRDLVRTLGTPLNFTEAARRIYNTPPFSVDTGKVKYKDGSGQKVRYFLNVAGMGLDGDIVARVNSTSKALGGFVSFLGGTVASLCRYRNKKMKITVDGKEICNEPITFIVVANGRYFGGGMFIAPHALMDDGSFDIIIARNLSKSDLLINLPKVYRGKHLDHPRITSLRGRVINVESDDCPLLNLDGEQPGCAPAEVVIQPQALNLRA